MKATISQDDGSVGQWQYKGKQGIAKERFHIKRLVYAADAAGNLLTSQE